VGLGAGPFIVGHAALKVASSKVTKHEKACSNNHHVFIPFAFDSFSFLAPEAIDLLHRVQNVMHSNVISPRSKNVVFTMISFAIQKRLAALAFYSSVNNGLYIIVNSIMFFISTFSFLTSASGTPVNKILN